MILKAKEKEVQWNNFKKLKTETKQRQRDDSKKGTVFSKSASKVITLNRMKSHVKNSGE
jgi:hypothetical protein